MDAAHMKGLLAAIVLAGLAGCAPEYLPVDAGGARTALPPKNPATQGRTGSNGNTEGSRAEGDRCGASSLAYLIGKPRTEIPVPTDPSRRRVVCTGCGVAGGSRADRQTITYDPVSGRVVAVVCG